MGSYVGLSTRIYVAHLDLSGLANQVNFGEIVTDMKDSTTFNDGGFKCVKPGIISGESSVTGFQDFAADVLDDEISTAQLGSQYSFTAIPNPTGTVTAADPCMFSRGIFAKHKPFDGKIGDMASFELGLPFDAAVVQAKVAHPLAARTTDGNGTAVALTGPTAAQKLYASLHVTAFSGLTNCVFKIQSDDNSSFTSATDRITFTTVTGTTHQFASVAGAFSSETHHRITWDVTGSGSISFIAAVGVI